MGEILSVASGRPMPLSLAMSDLVARLPCYCGVLQGDAGCYMAFGIASSFQTIHSSARVESPRIISRTPVAHMSFAIMVTKLLESVRAVMNE
jgi:hypothetical protein